MIDSYLDPEAWLVVRAARRGAFEKGTDAGPEEVLRALIELPSPRVAEVLEEYGVRFTGPHRRVRPGQPLARLNPDGYGAVMEAVAEARFQGFKQVRPDHLLYAMLAAAAGEPAQELRERGLTAEQARELSRAWTPPSLSWDEQRAQAAIRSQPAGVVGAHLLLVTQAACCGCTGSGSVLLSPGLDGLLPLHLAAIVWTAGLSVVGALCLGSGGPLFWAGTTGFFGARAASLLGVAALFLFSGSTASLPLLAAGAVHLLAARGLLAEHDWYGVGERERWRTLWRSGAWAILPTLALDLAVILVRRF